MTLVRHGRAVETREDAFVEGAWEGDFGQMAFDEAVALAGSGGHIRGDGVVFSTPFHPLEFLYVLATEDGVLVSNSLAFLFVEADDRPDIRHYNYCFDLLRLVRHGVPTLPVGFPTASGQRIRLFHVCNLRVDPDLTFHAIPKSMPPPPTCFGEYRDLLLHTVTSVAQNAATAERKQPYRLVSEVSRGYDSTAVTALVAQAGGRETVTYGQSSVDGTLADDSGTAIAACLGMTITEYNRSGVRNLPGFPEAEFFSRPYVTAAPPVRLVESRLVGVLLAIGRHGEDFWGLGRDCVRPGLREPEGAVMPGRGLSDFRLRVGYLQFPIPYIGALHNSHIHHITRAPEMRPWTLGTGSYDRPIARRIAEEAGVPRDFFGQRKLGGGGRALRSLNEASRRDLRDFCQQEVPPEILRRLRYEHTDSMELTHFRMCHLRKECAKRAFLIPLLQLAPLDRWHIMWNSIYLYCFHWGFERIRARYHV